MERPNKFGGETLNVAIWNMAYAKPGPYRSHPNRRRQWSFLAAVAPDIALLQECRPGDLRTHAPAWLAEEYETVGEVPSGWSAVSAVLARKTLRPRPVNRSVMPEPEHRWLEHLSAAVATAVVTVAGRDVLAASVHARVAPVDTPAVTYEEHQAVRRAALPRAWHCDLVAAALAPLARDRFLIGGDWNNAVLFDTTDPRNAPSAQFFAARAADGWYDALRKFSPEEQRTYLDPAAGPYELDHLFTDAEHHDRLGAAQVMSGYPAPQLSDHAMVLAGFAIA